MYAFYKKIMTVLLVAICLPASAMASMGLAKEDVQTTNETVVILHGIGHSKWNMFVTEQALKHQGYKTLAISYPSLDHDIGTLAGLVHEKLTLSQIWQQSTKVHFVTHSMGGLVTRRYLEDYKDKIPQEKLGRAVMMAPPHGGSEVADLLENLAPYKWVFGPAGQELTTETQSKNTIKPYYDVGIIAGSKGWPYFVADIVLPDAHDGRVAVEKTKWDGMTDHITMNATHSFISWKPNVHKQIVNFLQEGSFINEKQ